MDYDRLATASAKAANAVPASAEWHRIDRLPSRQWLSSEVDAIVSELSARLRQPGSTATLLPAQALSLVEAFTAGGLFAPLPVGSGKTLLSLLLPVFLTAKKPILIVPAALARKTLLERSRYEQQWRLPGNLRILSYERLSRESAARELEDYAPDALIFDECHKLKNPRAAVTRRVSRYLSAHPGVKVAAMSGTITKRSIKDFAHVVAWCLAHSPAPTTFTDLEAWSSALDVRVQEPRTRPAYPGPILRWCLPEDLADGDEHDHGRRGYRRRLVSTPGVVALSEQSVSCSLRVDAEWLDQPACAEAFTRLRTSWELPDGYELIDGPSVWRAARQIGLGFYYTLRVWPPTEWREKRRAWARLVRTIISEHGNRLHIDTEAQVASAIVTGHLPVSILADARAIRDEWKAIEPTFTPETITEWLSPDALDWADRWLTSERGILWCESVAFGSALADRGWSYYGAEGLDARKRLIDHAPTGRGIVASYAANKAGRNLQHFSANALTQVPKSGMDLEQCLGRTHRQGQLSDEVTARALITCAEDFGAIEQARKDAAYQQAITGQTSKLLACDWCVEDEGRTGSQWVT